MNTSYNWIKAYVPGLTATAQEYTDAMTLSGTKVEGFTSYDRNLKSIVVGRILELEPHPNANKLVVCRVDIGNGSPLQIVTGAPNAAKDQLVAVVTDGGKVAGDHSGNYPEDGFEIKAGALRGVESAGMMCSIEELGSDRNFYPEAPENGIYVFSEESGVKPGDDAIEALGLHDTVFEYEITSNRVDCYSVLGIAREAAATFRKPFVPPVVPETGNSEQASDYISVDVQDPALCPRYIARVVKNIKIGPSPEWMKRRLRASGIRPINNLVDITNYVMEEFGQPMHAFDYDQIAGHKIIVRRAADGDVFETLDGQPRKLDSNILMICDAEKEIALAGIMGGNNSKITDDVRTMVFECACFDGTNIRLSSKRLGLRTDSSGKFEKGLDPENAEAAVNRACALVEELGCGEVVGGKVDVYAKAPEKKEIAFRPDWINDFLGTDLSEETMLSYFPPLELEYDADRRVVKIPTFRQDLECEADLAEEVARFFGYDNVPTTLPTGEATAGKLSYKARVENVARDVLEYCGFSQGMNYSFESPKVWDKLRLPADSPLRQAVTILNPLGEDYSIMRTISLGGMLSSLATNYNRRNKNVRLYELANIYLPKAVPVTELPDERMQLTFGFYGEGDFFTLKAVAEEFFRKAGMKARAEYENDGRFPFFHPGRQDVIRYDGETVGYLGEVHPKTAEAFDLNTRAYIAVLDMPAILPFTNLDNKKYEGIARFPAVTRDLSMVMDKSLNVGTVEKMLWQRGGKILESVELFDVYEGEQVGAGKKSVAYKLVFRAKDRTLEEKDITGVMNKILNGLGQLGIELRA
ncbi:MAG: phenylalanine--tRNA ligase subunit beta [Lachnospiraceae bacterium]|nr:phenylalanine--tRNA ligase subunit beta [Lachnospiraceae bacterium]